MEDAELMEVSLALSGMVSDEELQSCVNGMWRIMQRSMKRERTGMSIEHPVHCFVAGILLLNTSGDAELDARFDPAVRRMASIIGACVHAGRTLPRPTA